MPAFSAAAIMRSACASVAAIGFSLMTWMPFAAAASTMSAPSLLPPAACTMSSVFVLDHLLPGGVESRDAELRFDLLQQFGLIVARRHDLDVVQFLPVVQFAPDMVVRHSRDADAIDLCQYGLLFLPDDGP